MINPLPYNSAPDGELHSINCDKLESSSSRNSPTPLGHSFVPGPFDVICARGKLAYNHVGNKRLRSIIEKTRDAYGNANTKAERGTVVSGIVEAIRSKGSGFVKKEKSGQWIEVGNLAREKVGQQLREALGSKYRSSHSAKKRRRHSTCSKVSQSLEDVMNSNQEVSQTIATLSQVLSTSPAASSDDDYLMRLFDQANSRILEVIKRENSLVEQFQEVFASVQQENTDEPSEGIVSVMETERSSWAE